jgi:transposase-like protein
MEICAETEESGVTREETKALKDHIVRLYSERYTCRQIADLTGLSYRYVRDSLKERGITPVRRVVRGFRVKRVTRRDTPER